ncbi:MAG: CRISPR-associated protein Cas4 [Planctomycetota bacterium]|nr:MAG: CRISPR-associated protein Cas4 [Planctomycetota bacterium]
MTAADAIPISALQHFLFCPRQCALIHLEGLWADNRLTVEGASVHRRAHDGARERRPGRTTERAVPLRSDRLGLRGVADVVEFHPGPASDTPAPYPVEYKRGRPKRHDADRVQLCAQALCLEEMLATPVPRGALFYHSIRRREEVQFTDALRAKTEATARAVADLLQSLSTPTARREKKCDRCSLLRLCLPGATGGGVSASAYLRSMIPDGPRPAPGDP